MSEVTGHPMLGLPEDVLREMASVDYHAGKKDQCLAGVPTPECTCPCQSEQCIGDFAVRFLTGQAQMSSTRSGIGALMASPTTLPTEMPRGIRSGDTSTPVLAGLVIHGTVEPADHDRRCQNSQPHECLAIEITGVGVLGHKKFDDDDIVAMLSEHLLHLASQRPTTEGDL